MFLRIFALKNIFPKTLPVREQVQTGVATTLDSEGRAVALSESMGGSGPYTGRWGYNLNDLPITLTVPGGVQGALGYDSSSRLTSLSLSGPASSPAAATLSSSYAYGYNALNWTTSTTTLSGTDVITHDAQGRLTSETGPQVVATGGAYAWTYDKNGNLTSQIGDDGFPVTYTYTQPITPNEVQTMVMGDGQPTAYYGYDAHGDTTAITDGAKLNTHVVYDSQARPVQITTMDRGTPLTVTLTYNPSGQRASYHVVEPGQPTLDEGFTYRSGVLGQVGVTNDGVLLYTDTYLYTEAGAPYELLRQQGGTTNHYWYELDGRGNVVALTDSNGKVVDRYAYDSWGELTSNDGVNETVPQQLRYAGYWYDEKLSWYWLSVRYYDPEIERFLAPDPSEQDGVRTYAYVNNDPIDATDPSGLCHIMLHFQPAFNWPFTSQPFLFGKHTYITLNNNNDANNYWLFEGTKHNGHILGGPDGQPASPNPQVVKRGSDPRINSDPTNSVTLLSDSTNCSCYIQKFVANAKAIDNLNGGQGLKYENPVPWEAGNLLYPINSNAYAYTIVSHRTGINVPKTLYSDNSGKIFLTKPFQYRAQDILGWGRDLLDPHWVAPSGLPDSEGA